MKNFNKFGHYFRILILMIFLISACTHNAPQQSPPSMTVPDSANERAVEKVAEIPKTHSLEKISTKDYETIKSSKIIIELKAENFALVPIGSPVKDDEGHFHVWLDSDKKLGPQTTFTFENITSGKHSIVAELVKSDHSSLNPKITKSVIINVESDYIPKVEARQESNTKEFTVDADDKGFYPNRLQAKIGDLIKINFKFKDESIYYGGLDVKGPFEIVKYRLKGEQPIAREFSLKEEAKITSYWPSTGVKKADLIIEVDK